MRRLAVALALVPAVAGAQPFVTPRPAPDVARVVRAAPREVRRAIAGRAVEAAAGDVVDATMHVIVLHDAEGRRVALFRLDDTSRDWTVFRGDEELRWSDTDGDGRPDERVVEHYDSPDRERLDERDTFVRRDRRWVPTVRELLRDCGARYRVLEGRRDGRWHTRWEPCFVS